MNNKKLLIHLGPCFACKKPSLLKFADYLEYIGLNVSEEKTEDDND